MSAEPLAYFITFATYGTWLHGDGRGSVDADHNRYDTPLLTPDDERRSAARDRMTQPPYVLDESRRTVVRDAVVEECRSRGWPLPALHVRSNHVHLVVTAFGGPEAVMKTLKTAASKALNRAGFEGPDRKRWATHGSTKYLWIDGGIADAVDYVLNRQGVPMAVYAPPGGTPSEPDPSEPERQ